MAEGVTTRLQKDVNQLQKDMEQVVSKVDGLADQLRGEFQAEIIKGFEVLRLEIFKANQKSPEVAEEVLNSAPMRSNDGSSGVITPSLLGKNRLGQANTTSSILSNSGKFNSRRSKLECPRFDGFDFLGWKLKVEQYFEAVTLPEEEKVPTVMIYLDGKALQWHQRFLKSHGDVNKVPWSTYVLEMRRRFCDLEYADPMSELVSLKHTNSVEEYYEEFEALLNLLQLSDEYALSVFVSNLKPEISKSVRLFYPKTINHALSLAKQMEVVLYNLPRKPFHLYKYPAPTQHCPQNYQQPSIPSSKPTFNTNSKLPPLLPTPKALPTHYPNTTNTNLKTPFVKSKNQGYNNNFTREERDERKRRGLCMWCGVKYTREHNCVKSRLYQLLVEDTGQKEAEFEEFADCVDTLEPMGGNGEDVGTLHAISLHALVGTEDHHTIRLEGRIKNQSLMILVDSGNSHNFLNQNTTKRLNCRVQLICGLQITVANGEIMKTHEMCKGVPVEMQGFRQSIDFFLLPLQGCDIVLGIQWLKSLGPIQWDFNTLSMRFKVQDLDVCFRGLQGGAIHVASKNQMSKLSKASSKGVLTMLISESSLLQLELPTLSDTLDQQQQWELQVLLQQYASLFETPTSLPPKRSHDHEIPLKDEGQVVKLKPYRYPPL